MTNKKKLEEQAENLQKELNKLKEEIKKCDEIDLFSITTYKQVCKALNEEEVTSCNFKGFSGNLIKKLVATARIEQLERLYNQNWTKDYSNSNQYKWKPYFKFGKGKWALYYSYFGSWPDFTVIGVFKDEKTSNYIGKTFLDEIFVDILEN